MYKNNKNEDINTFKEEFENEVNIVLKEHRIKAINVSTYKGDGIAFYDEEMQDNGVDSRPIFYYKSIYEKFNESHTDMNTFIKNIVPTIIDAVDYGAKIKNDMVKEVLKTEITIIPELVNKDSNAELLENVPHRVIHDLALIYRKDVMLGNKDFGYKKGTAIVTNKLADKLNLDESKLYELSKEYIKNNIEVTSMFEVINKELDEEGFSEEAKEVILS